MGRILMRAFDLNGNRTGLVEHRNVAAHLSKDDDSRLRDLTVAVVDDEVIRSPKPQRALREASLPRGFRQRCGQPAGLFLTQMIAHLDRDRQHPQKRSGCLIVSEFSSHLAPCRGNYDTFLRHSGPPSPKKKAIAKQTVRVMTSFI